MGKKSYGANIVDFFLNELSIRDVESPAHKSCVLNNLIVVIKNIKHLTDDCNILYHKEIDKEIGNDENLKGFINSANILQDSKRFLFGILSKNPIVEYYPEYKFSRDLTNLTECYGLGLSIDNDTFSLSLNSNDIWEKDKINIIRIELDDRLDEIKTEVEADNIALKDHLQEHKKRIDCLIKIEETSNITCIHSGTDLENKSYKIFPNIVFCNNVIEYIKQYKTKTAEFKYLIKQLTAINNLFKEEDPNIEKMKNSLIGNPRQEFEQRRQIVDKKISNTLPNIINNFYWHIDTYQGNGRIHFYPDFNNYKCYIGYIGKKILE